VAKRPFSFFGRSDATLTRDGQVAENAETLWSLVGKEAEREPLILRDYLSYDEMAISALIGISSPTYFVNVGAPSNGGKKGKRGSYTQHGVFVGLVGARFENPSQMESRFLIESSYCTEERGYGFAAEVRTHERAILQMWGNFSGVQDVDTGLHGFPIIENTTQHTLVMERYKRRMSVTLESFLLEAELRGKESHCSVRPFVVGLGLGV
jgi:Domain of unknown function (DUF4804)